MKHLTHKSNWNDVEWLPVRGGMERKTFTGEGATLAYFRIQPDHEVVPHSHIYEQIVYLIEGAADFHVGEEVHQLVPGSLLVVPPNVVHYIRVTSDTPVLEMDVFTPKRPEYGG